MGQDGIAPPCPTLSCPFSRRAARAAGV